MSEPTPECKYCGRESSKLRDVSGDMICHECAYFSEPEKIVWVPTSDFPSTASVKSDVNHAVCVTCSSTQFMVAKSSYYTAVKCMKCGWEARVHEG